MKTMDRARSVRLAKDKEVKDQARSAQLSQDKGPILGQTKHVLPNCV